MSPELSASTLPDMTVVPVVVSLPAERTVTKPETEPEERVQDAPPFTRTLSEMVPLRVPEHVTVADEPQSRVARSRTRSRDKRWWIYIM